MSRSNKKITQARQGKKAESGDASKLFTGLVIGFLAGSTSYFLFHSKQGRELREDIKDKWADAQKDLPTLKDLKIGDLSIAELISIVLGTNIEKKKSSKLKIKSSPKIGMRSKNKKPSKFKRS